MDNPTAAKARVRLSVGMIVRDEEDVLAESLDSVRAIADEMLVLDTGSTDRTTEVAQRLGARVICAPWTDDFASARNRTNTSANLDATTNRDLTNSYRSSSAIRHPTPL
jgi:glycosyltransferase involved in cell wall biosynthesis